MLANDALGSAAKTMLKLVHLPPVFKFGAKMFLVLGVACGVLLVVSTPKCPTGSSLYPTAMSAGVGGSLGALSSTRRTRRWMRFGLERDCRPLTGEYRLTPGVRSIPVAWLVLGAAESLFVLVGLISTGSSLVSGCTGSSPWFREMALTVGVVDILYGLFYTSWYLFARRQEVETGGVLLAERSPLDALKVHRASKSVGVWLFSRSEVESMRCSDAPHCDPLK